MAKKKKVKKKIKVVDPKKKARFIRLSWEVLAHKFLYYKGQDHGLPANTIIDDHEYDKIEDEYKGLAEELDLPASASDMVGFDESKFSCRTVMQQLILHKGKLIKQTGSTRKAVKKEIKEMKDTISLVMEQMEEVLEELSIPEKTIKKIRIRMKKRMKP